MDAIEIVGGILIFVLLMWFLASIPDPERSVQAIISGFLLVLFVLGLIYYNQKLKE